MATQIAQDKGYNQLMKERQEFLTREYGELVGKTIKHIRPMTQTECDEFLWKFGYERTACVVVFTDGTFFIPLSDPEGNSAGFLGLGKEEL